MQKHKLLECAKILRKTSTISPGKYSKKYLMIMMVMPSTSVSWRGLW